MSEHIPRIVQHNSTLDQLGNRTLQSCANQTELCMLLSSPKLLLEVSCDSHKQIKVRALQPPRGCSHMPVLNIKHHQTCQSHQTLPDIQWLQMLHANGAEVESQHPAPIHKFNHGQTTFCCLLCVQDGAEAEHGHQGIKGAPVCVATPSPRGPHVVLLPGGSSTASHCLTSGTAHPEENVKQLKPWASH